MDYLEDIEPIHELPSDEFEDRLWQTLNDLKFLWNNAEASPKESFEDIQKQVNYTFNTLIHSIKRSILYFYPDRKDELSGIVDFKEARWYLSIMEQSRSFSSPLYEGVQAISKIYLMFGPHYKCVPEDIEIMVTEFHETERAIFQYSNSARSYYHKRTMKEAKPLMEEGVKRFNQLHAPKEKRNKYVLAYCRELVKKKPSNSALHLFSRFPYSEENAVEVGGARIFREFNLKAGEEKIITYMPNGQRKALALRGFTKAYWKDFKEKNKKRNVNS